MGVRLSPSSARLALGVLPARRMLAVDAGNRTIKLLLLEEMFGRLRVLDRRLIEPVGDDRVDTEDCLAEVRSLFAKVGECPVALALPHYRALSQVLDLDSRRPEEVRTAIEEESRKLSGLGESRMVHDFSQLSPFGRRENPFWVTFCPEEDVQHQIRRCGLADLDLCEVTTTANALVAAYQSLRPGEPATALVDLGASGTLVTILLEGQPVYTAGYALGVDAWAEAVATAESCSTAEAHRRIREEPFPSASPETLGTCLQHWHDELVRLLEEGLREQVGESLGLKALTCVLAGGGAELPGLLAGLRLQPALQWAGWPARPEDETCPVRYAVAYGAALHALGHAAQPASLLPDEVRLYWNRNHSLHVLYSILFFLLALLTVVLGVGTWQQLSWVGKKREMRAEAEAALSAANSAGTLSADLSVKYGALRPVLQRQRETFDGLATLALLQRARSNQVFWYVLFASRRDYFQAAPYPTTNALAMPSAQISPPTVAKEGFVVELCVPESGEAGRRAVSRLVTGLRESPLFRNVDSLPDDRRRPLVDPSVLVPDGHFALELDLSDNPFSAPIPLTERSVGSGVGGAARPSWADHRRLDPPGG